jgi:hypothetical protein
MQQSKKIYIIILFIFFVIFTETNKINFIIQIVLNFFVAFVMIDCSRCWLEVVTDNCATTVLFLSFVPTSDYVPSEWFFSRHLKTSSVPSVPVPVPSPLISRFRFRFRVVEIEKLRFRFGYRYRFFWNRRALPGTRTRSGPGPGLPDGLWSLDTPLPLGIISVALNTISFSFKSVL